MNEQQAEPASAETTSHGASPAIPASADASGQPMASVPDGMASPDLVPEQGDAPKADASGAELKAEMPKAEALEVEAPKSEAPKSEAKADAPRVEIPKADAPRIPGRLMIMSAADHAGNHEGAGPDAETGPSAGRSGKRRLSAMAAVVVLATVAGALGGALATGGLAHFTGADTAASNHPVPAAEAAIARIDAELLALKASVEQTSKVGLSQYNKTGDRLDKVEKAQAEPAAKLARLSEAVEKLRAAPAAVAAPVAAARDVTGSIAPQAAAVAAPVPLPAPKPEVARLPTVDGWVLREVANGSALIEGRQGMFEVYAGDPVPGLGRVDAIRKQDGRWVVVTSKGLVVAR